MNDIDEEILNDIYRLVVDCPECKYMEDDQYTCTTCWHEGGNGKLNVFNWLKDHPEYLK